MPESKRFSSQGATGNSTLSVERLAIGILFSLMRQSWRNEIVLSGKALPDLFTPYQGKFLRVKLFKPFFNTILLAQGITRVPEASSFGGGGTAGRNSRKRLSAGLEIVRGEVGKNGEPSRQVADEGGARRVLLSPAVWE